MVRLFIEDIKSRITGGEYGDGLFRKKHGKYEKLSI